MDQCILFKTYIIQINTSSSTSAINDRSNLNIFQNNLSKYCGVSFITIKNVSSITISTLVTAQNVPLILPYIAFVLRIYSHRFRLFYNSSNLVLFSIFIMFGIDF
ncbi:hypothetical protein H311_00582 [Anncaliia algerae PRA109]|nr:hypothetical protein H311_00582 [Anncaliia algerae PRA109]